MNLLIRYSLVDPSAGAEETFSIDRTTGMVRLARTVDFEQRRLYNLTVRARDRGDPPLEGVTQLLLEVVDVNANLHPPIFKVNTQR